MKLKGTVLLFSFSEEIIDFSCYELTEKLPIFQNTYFLIKRLSSLFCMCNC